MDKFTYLYKEFKNIYKMSYTRDNFTLSTGKEIEIYQSEGDFLGWDNFGTMICFHNNYDLGHKHDLNSNDYNNWQEVEKAIMKEYNVKAILPLYLYDHSGITISTEPFGCRWDSGQVGFIIATKENIEKLTSIKRVTKQYKEKLEGYLKEEVNTYDKELTGDVWGFTTIDKEGETDSCSGFYGDNWEENGILDHMCLTEEEQ